MVALFMGLSKIHWEPRENGCHFTAILKHIFLYENLCITIKILLKFVSKGSVNNKQALVQKLAGHQIDNKPLCEWMTA